MFFIAIPPLAALIEVVVTTTIGTLVALATKDAYDKFTANSDNE
jgi:hypothetical protein